MNAFPGSTRGVLCGCDAGYILEQDGDTCRGATFLLIPFGAMVTPNGHTQWSHPNTKQAASCVNNHRCQRYRQWRI